jgi:hypothetical protein
MKAARHEFFQGVSTLLWRGPKSWRASEFTIGCNNEGQRPRCQLRFLRALLLDCQKFECNDFGVRLITIFPRNFSSLLSGSKSGSTCTISMSAARLEIGALSNEAERWLIAFVKFPTALHKNTLIHDSPYQLIFHPSPQRFLLFPTLRVSGSFWQESALRDFW